MTIPDKLSDAGKKQLAQQIDFFQALTTRAFENAERLVALNLQTTRAALEHTTGAVRQLADVRDPRDLLGLTRQTQAQVDAAMVYSRKLFEIANQPAMPPAASASASAPGQHIETAAPVMVSEPVVQAAPTPVDVATVDVAKVEAAPVEAAPAIAADAVAPVGAAPVTVSATLDEPAEPATATAPATSAILPSKHPLGEAEPAPEPAMTAKARPIAKAAGKVAATPVDTPHPAASPMPEAGPIAIPAIAPVDAVAAPIENVAPPQPKRSSSNASKGNRKR